MLFGRLIADTKENLTWMAELLLGADFPPGAALGREMREQVVKTVNARTQEGGHVYNPSPVV